MRLNAGWIAAQPDLDAAVYYNVTVPRRSNGTKHDPEGAVFGTRIEEYGWVAQQLENWHPHLTAAPRKEIRLLDAGAGFNPEIHVLSEILGNMGYLVTAVDTNPESLHMPPHLRVVRAVDDITKLGAPDATYDVWVCVSVLEHLSKHQETLLLREAFRVLQLGGLALLTTDHTPPEYLISMLHDAGFKVGFTEPFFGQHLNPRVSYIAAQKPL